MSQFSLKTMSKSRLMMMKFVIMLISADVMATAGVVNPAMGVFTKAFPAAGPSMISLIATIITVFMLPSGLLAGKLAEKINKKTIALVGFVFYVIGGVGPVFLSDIYQILALRGVLGIGAGLLNPLSMSMIRDVFDGKERASMMGYAQAIGSIAVILLQMLAGFLAVQDYHLTFLAYAPMILVPILAWFYLPADAFVPQKAEPQTVETQKVEIKKDQPREKVPLIVYGLGVIAIINGIALKFFLIKFAIYLMEENLGTAATAGSLLSLQIIGMFLVSLVFGRIYATLKYFTLVASWGGLVVALSLLYFFPSLISCAVALFLFGLAFASVQPFFYMLISVITPKSKATMGLAIFQTGLQLAAFLATFVTSALLVFMPHATTREQFIAPLTVYSVLTIGALICAIVLRKSPILGEVTNVH
jgi:MFS family permease